MSHLGDINTSQVLYFHFTTRQFSTGTPITSASLVLSVYKDDSATQSTSGITTTFTGGFDSVAGLVSVKIDTSSDGTFYAAGHDFSVVITAGTADSVSIVGEVVGGFSIQNRSALRPTTAGRTLLVDSGGDVTFNNTSIATVTTVGTLTTYTGNTPQTGDAYAYLGTNLGSTGANLTNVAIGNAILDQANGIETGLTPRQAIRVIGSTTGGKLSGAGSGTETFRNAVADSTNRVVATVDSSGNRTAISYTLT